MEGIRKPYVLIGGG